MMATSTRINFSTRRQHMTIKIMNESDTVRQSWKSYDVLSPEGSKIEVKASGYIQAWPQEKLSSVSFSIRPAHSWDMETSTYADELTRDSDVYVFCLSQSHRTGEP